MRRADAIVVGSGPNGLAGRVDHGPRRIGGRRHRGRRTTPGGGCRTEELTLPGFHHDVCSAVHPLLSASPFFRGMDLSASRGEPPHAAGRLRPPARRGRAAAVAGHGRRDRGRTSARTAPPMRGCSPRWCATRTASCPTFLAPAALDPAHPLATASFGLKGLASAERLATDSAPMEARAIVAGAAAHSMLPFTHRCPARSACCSPCWRTRSAGPWSRVAARASSMPSSPSSSPSMAGSSPGSGSRGCTTSRRPGRPSST